MDTEKRISLLAKLGAYMLGNDEAWLGVKHRAVVQNAWFTPEHIDEAVAHIGTEYLEEAIIRS